MKNRVLIIGAGLGGLALAQGLAKSGIQATVFERDASPTSRPQGYRISIRSLGIQALSTLLTSEKWERLPLAKVADVGDGFTCANENMEPFFTVPKGHDTVVQFLRTELRSLLQEGINIEWNKRLVKFEEIGDRVIAHFQDGSQEAGDLLVGCDGVGSIVRELLSVYGRSIPKIVMGNRAILGGQVERTPEWNILFPLNQTGMVRYIDSEYSIGVCFSERADRSPTIYWALSEKITDRFASWYQFDQNLKSRKQLLDHCKEVMRKGSWHENLKKLVEDTPVQEIMVPWLTRTTRFPHHYQYCMTPTGRVTLLGDSAHAMPPDLALGGNNVLEDARLLSDLLASSSKPIDWPKLVGKYESEMFKRAKMAVDESENAVNYFQTLLKGRS